MRASAISLLALFVAVSLAAQEVKTSAAIDVPVTSLDLIVTDGKGNRVKGLAKDEFEVSEGGQAREITNFVEVGSEADDTPRAPRRVMLVFDNMTLTLANRKMFATAAREFLGKLAPSDLVMVASLTSDVTPRTPWTTDRAATLAAIDVVAKEAPIGRAEMQRRRVEQDIRNTRVGDSIAAASQQGSNVSFDALTAAVRNYAAALMYESTQMVNGLGGALRQFGKAPGRRIVILAGEGLALRPGADMYEYLETVRNDIVAGGGSASLQRSARTATPMGDATEFDLSPAIRTLGQVARRNGVVFYPLNPGSNEKSSGGVENQEFVNTTSEFATTAGQAGGYQVLARDTGGLAFQGAKAPLAFEQIARDLDASYSIAYRSSEAPKVEALTVRSKSGHRVRYSVAGGGASPEDLMNETVMANHASPVAANDLEITLAMDPVVAADGKRRVPLKVMIPVKNLKFDPEGKEIVGGFTVFISPGDTKGNATSVSKQGQQLRWPAEALPYLAGKSMTFAVDVMLDPGRNQISIGVLDQKSNKTGFAKIAVP